MWSLNLCLDGFVLVRSDFERITVRVIEVERPRYIVVRRRNVDIERVLQVRTPLEEVRGSD